MARLFADTELHPYARMSMPLFMQWSIHETNTFQFASSAKLAWRTENHEKKTLFVWFVPFGC
jgi:hypothetical protein